MPPVLSWRANPSLPMPAARAPGCTVTYPSTVTWVPLSRLRASVMGVALGCSEPESPQAASTESVNRRKRGPMRRHEENAEEEEVMMAPNNEHSTHRQEAKRRRVKIHSERITS